MASKPEPMSKRYGIASAVALALDASGQNKLKGPQLRGVLQDMCEIETKANRRKNKPAN